MRFFLLGLMVLLAAGCSPVTPAPSPTTTPASPPQSLPLAYPTALRPLLGALEICAQRQPGAALVTREIPAADVEDSSGLLFSLGAPAWESPFAAALAEEELVVILHPQNPVDALDAEAITALYQGSIRSWAELGGPEQEVVVWTYPQGDEARRLFDRVFLADQEVSGMARLAADPQAMVEEVSQNRWAVGYIPRAWLTDEVKIPELPGDLRSELRQPVLALFPARPEGELRTLLHCMQSGAGQTVIRELYTGGPSEPTSHP